jgi:autotransporter-associated beta strand protein
MIARPAVWPTFCLVGFLAVSAGADIVFHVAPSGSDTTGDGSGAAPWKTLAAARDAIRNSGINANMQDDIVVNLHGGRYELSGTLEFTPADSGSNGRFITYQSYPGERASITGGKRVTGWAQVPGKPYWVAPVPASSGYADYFRQIYVNGIRAERARSKWINGVGYFDDPSTTQAIDGITFNTADLKTFSNVSDLRLLHVASFKVDEFPILSIQEDAANGLKKVRLQQPYCQLRYDRGEGFFEATDQWMIVQAFEELDEPGEWYLNRTTRQLYYYPNSFENMEAVQVDVPVVDTLVRFTGTSTTNKVRNIRMKDLIIEHGNWLFPRDYYFGGVQAEIFYAGRPATVTYAPAAYEMPGQILLNQTSDIQFIGNIIRRHGSCGIHPYNGAMNTLIQGNIFDDLTGAAVIGGRFNPTLAIANQEICQNTVVSNNVIRNTGSDFMGSSLINNLQHLAFQVTHNDMADGQYMGFHQRNLASSVAAAAGTGGTVVSSNRIRMGNSGGRYGVGDGGYIYTFGVWPNSLVEGNDIDTIYVANGNLSGFYLDNDSYGIAINGNVMRGVKAGSMGYKFVRSLNSDSTLNSANGNWGDSTLNWFKVVTDPNYHQMTQGQPLPAAAQAIVDSAGLEPAYQHLLNRIHDATDLARGKTASSSSQWNNTTPPSAAVDWNYDSKWHQASEDSSSWWSVDLGDSYVIRRLEIAARVDLDQPDSRSNFQVQGSNDSGFSTFTVLAEQNDTPFPYRKTGLSNSWVRFVGNPNGFRYLRVIKTAAGGLNFSEFQAYGYPATSNATGMIWDAGANGEITDGPGNWYAPDQWWDGSENQSWVDGTNVSFGNNRGAAGVVSLGTATARINSLAFNPGTSGNYTIAGGQLASVAGVFPVSVTANMRPVISSGISGASLAMSGPGTLTLSGNNTFTGGVTINSGTLIATNSTSLGTGAKNIVMNTGGASTFKLDGSAAAISMPANISFQTSGLQAGGSIVNVTGANTIHGNITLNSGAAGTAISVDSGTLVLAGTISRAASGTRGVRLQGAGNGTISGVIASSVNGGLFKHGGGTWTLSGTSAHTGSTTVNDGVLAITKPFLADGSGVLIANSAKIALNFDESSGPVTDTVASLTIAGQAKAPGTWGATGSSANFIDNLHFSGPGTLTVATGPAATDYESWSSAAVHGLSGGPVEDDDGDGLSNFQEYAFGLDPTDPASLDPFPVLLEKGAGAFTYLRRNPSLGSGLSYTIWTSKDLRSWNRDAGAVQFPGDPDGSGTQEVMVTLSLALLVSPKLFVKVAAE